MAMQSKSKRPAETLRPFLVGYALALAVSSGAHAQEVESLFLTGQDAAGYYISNAGRAKLEVAVLVDLNGERPIALGARIEIKKRFFAAKQVNDETTTGLVAAGRQGSVGRGALEPFRTKKPFNRRVVTSRASL